MTRLPALLLLPLLSLPVHPLSAAPTTPAPILSAPAPYAWKNVNITGGGFISGIVPHPAEAGLMYVRTDVGGAYRWDPSARRWQPILEWIDSDNWTLTGIESIGLDPTDPDRVYLAAGSYTNNWSGNGSILRSADRGATWQITPMPFKFGGNELGRSNGERLAVDPSSPNILYVGSRKNGLWRSADHGATWSEVKGFSTPEDTKGIGVVAVVFPPRIEKSATPSAPSPVLYAAVSSPTAPLWRSDDAGLTWAPVAGQPLGLRPHQTKFGPDGWLYLTYGDDAGPNGLSDGAVWKHQPASGEWIDITPLKPSDGDRFGYGGLGLDAQKPGTLVVSTLCRWAHHDELFRSTDGGTTWKRISPTATFDENGVAFLRWGKPKADLGHWIGDLEIDPFNSGHALYGTGMTIWATDNLAAVDRDEPTAWIVRAQGVEETVINDLVSPAAGAPLLSVMWDIDGFRHENLDVSPVSGFFKPSQGHNTGLDGAGLRPDLAARVHHKGGAFTSDNGRTWTPFSPPPETKGDGRIAVSANGGSLVWTPNDAGTWFSRDQGATWKKSSGLPDGLRPMADRVREGRFYAFDAREGRVYVSTNHGAAFHAAAKLEARGGLLHTVPGRRDHVWIASDQGLFRSEDAGTTFARVTTEATGTHLGFGRAATRTGFPTLFLAGRVAGQKGVFRSTDEGRSWIRVNPEGLAFHSISALVGDPRVFGRVYVGSRGRGIFYGEPAPAPSPVRQKTKR